MHKFFLVPSFLFFLYKSRLELFVSIDFLFSFYGFPWLLVAYQNFLVWFFVILFVYPIHPPGSCFLVSPRSCRVSWEYAFSAIRRPRHEFHSLVLLEAPLLSTFLVWESHDLQFTFLLLLSFFIVRLGFSTLCMPVLPLRVRPCWFCKKGWDLFFFTRSYATRSRFFFMYSFFTGRLVCFTPSLRTPLNRFQRTCGAM